jgi:type IV pilus assembly protein PilA
MIKKFKKNEKGFTLVELVVVIAILALLAALLVPRIMGNVEDARASREVANARTIASEISTHNALAKVNSTGTIPATLGTAVIASSGHMTELGRDASDVPDSRYADIMIDSDGNATVIIKSY